MNAKDLAQFNTQNKITAEIIHLPTHTPTVAAAAEAVGARPDQIIKSLLFIADGQPVLVILNGLRRIDRKRLADAIGISRRRVKIASAEKVQTITGYPVGAVPPFGHPAKLHTLLDEGVLAETAVYGGGGEINALMFLTTDELLRVITPEIVNVSE